MSKDDSTSPSAPASPSSTLVGRRLAAVREELHKQFPEGGWSQKGVAQKTGLTQNIIWRIEQGEGGKVESWLRVLSLYESKGYNLNWVLAETNTRESKFKLVESTSTEANRLLEELLKKLDNWQSLLGEEFTAVRELILASARN